MQGGFLKVARNWNFWKFVLILKMKNFDMMFKDNIMLLMGMLFSLENHYPKVHTIYVYHTVDSNLKIMCTVIFPINC